MSAKNWVFTLNNPEEEQYEELKQRFQEKFNDGTIGYAVFQPEVGETTGTLHFQGYLQLTKKHRVSTVKKVIGDSSVHLEIARGTAQECIDYCTKEETRVGESFIIGTPVNEGQRTDLKILCEGIRDKKLTVNRICYLDPLAYARNFRGLEKLQARIRRPCRRPNIIVIWIHGQPRSGKSKLADQLAAAHGDENTFYWNSSKWFDGYEFEDLVIFEDYRSDQLHHDHLLTICDHYPKRVENKGGMIAMLSTKFIFTTLYRPEVTFPTMSQSEMAQMLGRIDKIVNIDAGETCSWSDFPNYSPMTNTDVK